MGKNAIGVNYIDHHFFYHVDYLYDFKGASLERSGDQVTLICAIKLTTPQRTSPPQS